MRCRFLRDHTLWLKCLILVHLRRAVIEIKILPYVLSLPFLRRLIQLVLPNLHSLFKERRWPLLTRDRLVISIVFIIPQIILVSDHWLLRTWNHRLVLAQGHQWFFKVLLGVFLIMVKLRELFIRLFEFNLFVYELLFSIHFRKYYN